MESRYDFAVSLRQASEFFDRFPQMAPFEGVYPFLGTLPGGRVAIHWSLTAPETREHLQDLLVTVQTATGEVWSELPSDFYDGALELPAGALQFTVGWRD